MPTSLTLGSLERAACGSGVALFLVLPVGVGDTAPRGAMLLSGREGPDGGGLPGAAARWEEQGLGGDLGACGETGSSVRRSPCQDSGGCPGGKVKGQLDRKGRAGRGSQMCRGGGRQPGPITRGSQGPRCDGDTRRVSLQPLRPRGAVVGRQQQQKASEPLSRLWAPPDVSPMTPSGHCPWRGRAPKAHPRGAGPVKAGCPGCPLSAPGALHLRFRLVHTLAFGGTDLSSWGRAHRGAPSQEPTDRPVCSEAASPFLPEFKPSLACTRAWGWPTPSLTPDPARWVLSNSRRFNRCGSLTWAGSWVFGAGWVNAQHLEATGPHV